MYMVCSGMFLQGWTHDQKKAIPISELHMLLNKDPQSEKLRRTQAIANLLFQFCGMPFSDLAHLEKSNLKQGLLKYNRLKTGTPMSIDTAVPMMDVRIMYNIP